MTKKIAPLPAATIALVAASCGDDDDQVSPHHRARRRRKPSQRPDFDRTPRRDGDRTTAKQRATPHNCTLDASQDRLRRRPSASFDVFRLSPSSRRPGAGRPRRRSRRSRRAAHRVRREEHARSSRSNPEQAAQELLDEDHTMIGPTRSPTPASPLLDTVNSRNAVVYMASTDPQASRIRVGVRIPRQAQRSGAVAPPLVQPSPG